MVHVIVPVSSIEIKLQLHGINWEVLSNNVHACSILSIFWISGGELLTSCISLLSGPGGGAYPPIKGFLAFQRNHSNHRYGQHTEKQVHPTQAIL
jgi:hypothetical protein